MVGADIRHTRSWGGLKAEQRKKRIETDPLSIFYLPVGLADLVIGATLRKPYRAVNRQSSKFCVIDCFFAAKFSTYLLQLQLRGKKMPHPKVRQ